MQNAESIKSIISDTLTFFMFEKRSNDLYKQITEILEQRLRNCNGVVDCAVVCDTESNDLKVNVAIKFLGDDEYSYIPVEFHG